LLKRCGFAPVRETTWSARTAVLHDGADAIAATKLGRKLPMRARRLAGSALTSVGDVLGYGSIVEHIAVRWSEPVDLARTGDDHIRPEGHR
jgi:hypothetical protein